ncbi:hypothetical protein DFP72DRAFT_926442 [Ephemerocybe angulata]|uniref:Uncharacterized protein n=1 Tax=Ephemerocybe angulata TaxID=980116 RepID=A0A8H6HE72_9AGAR|nr:hypothetical protein DFP72DRAFT_926442 [Tulosesus angulatus]
MPTRSVKPSSFSASGNTTGIVVPCQLVPLFVLGHLTCTCVRRMTRTALRATIPVRPSPELSFASLLGWCSRHASLVFGYLQLSCFHLPFPSATLSPSSTYAQLSTPIRRYGRRPEPEPRRSTAYRWSVNSVRLQVAECSLRTGLRMRKWPRGR